MPSIVFYAYYHCLIVGTLFKTIQQSGENNNCWLFVIIKVKTIYTWLKYIDWSSTYHTWMLQNSENSYYFFRYAFFFVFLYIFARINIFFQWMTKLNYYEWLRSISCREQVLDISNTACAENNFSLYLEIYSITVCKTTY